MTTLKIKVKPYAKTSGLQQQPDQTWLAQLKSPPVDGKANAELLALVAQHFQCPKSAVRIVSGGAGRMKWVRVEEQ